MSLPPEIASDPRGRIPASEPSHTDPQVKDQFADAEQQRQTAEVGMWVFLATEVMFFGAFFTAFFIYHYWYPQAFFQASQHMDVVLGTLNTVILITSSYTMVLAVHAAEHSRRRLLIGLLIATITLGTLFLGIKGVEYYHKSVDHLIPFAGWNFAPTGELRAGMQTFFNLYFLLTGLHALHVIIGIGLLAILLYRACRKQSFGNRCIIAHNVGLYWHFVDLVWVYLFPVFYLLTTKTTP